MAKMHSILIVKRLPDGLVIGIKFSSDKLEDLYKMVEGEDKDKKKEKS